jgi:hypothetical protein
MKIITKITTVCPEVRIGTNGSRTQTVTRTVLLKRKRRKRKVPKDKKLTKQRLRSQCIHSLQSHNLQK